MTLLDVKRRRLRALLVGAAMLGIGSASLSGTLAGLAAQPSQAAPARGI
jgi:hypothetical protein